MSGTGTRGRRRTPSASAIRSSISPYRGRGRWVDLAFAERAYLILSLVAKSALAWQVYAGALAGG